MKKGDQKSFSIGVRWTIISLRPLKVKVETADQRGVYKDPYIVRIKKAQW